jgi:hypothetical protein
MERNESNDWSRICCHGSSVETARRCGEGDGFTNTRLPPTIGLWESPKAASNESVRRMKIWRSSARHSRMGGVKGLFRLDRFSIFLKIQCRRTHSPRSSFLAAKDFLHQRTIERCGRPRVPDVLLRISAALPRSGREEFKQRLCERIPDYC